MVTAGGPDLTVGSARPPGCAATWETWVCCSSILATMPLCCSPSILTCPSTPSNFWSYSPHRPLSQSRSLAVRVCCSFCGPEDSGEGSGTGRNHYHNCRERNCSFSRPQQQEGKIVCVGGWVLCILPPPAAGAVPPNASFKESPRPPPAAKTRPRPRPRPRP